MKSILNFQFILFVIVLFVLHVIKYQTKMPRKPFLKVKLLFCWWNFNPIIEDQVDVFENEYAKVKLISKSETETVNSLFKEKLLLRSYLEI
jgi:phosphate transport system substrate-binding protein